MFDVEAAVKRRYSSASKMMDSSLCCPVTYDSKYLEVLPRELIERDYGCGDPSRWLQEGETVLDLGSGSGKICYIAAQIVGRTGRVIGVDMNDDMLALARRYQSQIAEQLGHDNVTFLKGRIQDLAFDLEAFDAYLRQKPVQNLADWLAAQERARRQRTEHPMIASDSIDVVISNCVLNLVQPADRTQLFAEVYRVLRCGGRAVISDIVCDEPVPPHLLSDPTLWSGCISGAYVEHDLLNAFADAGFYGMQLVDRPDQPWATVEGIEFRSVTVRAYKGKEGPSMDHNQAVIYKGPWKQVIDDDGQVLRRGLPMAVSEKTYAIYTRQPYADQVVPVPPKVSVPSDAAQPFDGRRDPVRDPGETKRLALRVTELPSRNCCGGSC
jgi:ubiquinone/menaquinone biosynthesis C-methylase UbiE